MVSRVTTTLAVEAQRWPLVQGFLGDPGDWLPLPAEPRASDSWLTTVRAGPFLQSVVAHVNPAWSLPDAHSRHLRWNPVGLRAENGALQRALPAFEGQLSLRVAHAGATSVFRDAAAISLVLSGHYTPPGGRIGEALDAAGLHRVATTTARNFLVDVAERLGATVVTGTEARTHAWPGTHA